MYNDAVLSILRFLPARDLLLTQSRVCKGWAQLAWTAARRENPDAHTWKDALAPVWTVIDPMVGVRGKAHCVSLIRVNEWELCVVSAVSSGEMENMKADTIVKAVHLAHRPDRSHLIAVQSNAGHIGADWVARKLGNSFPYSLMFVTQQMHAGIAIVMANGVDLSFASPAVERTWEAIDASDRRALLAMLHPWWV